MFVRFGRLFTPNVVLSVIRYLIILPSDLGHLDIRGFPHDLRFLEDRAVPVNRQHREDPEIEARL